MKFKTAHKFVVSRTGESKLRVKVDFLWHTSICTSTQQMLFFAVWNSRKRNDLYEDMIHNVFLSNQCNVYTKENETRGLMSYLIQFLGLWFEPTHVDGEVAVLLLQQLHPKNTKILFISMCLYSRSVQLVILGETVLGKFLQFML